MPDGRKFSYWVEDEVTAAGGSGDGEPNADESVIIDGDRISERGPGSSVATVRMVLDEFGIEGRPEQAGRLRCGPWRMKGERRRREGFGGTDAEVGSDSHRERTK